MGITGKRLARPVDIIGVGLSEFGLADRDPAVLNVTARESWALAVSRAIQDAGISVSQIEASFTGNMRGDYYDGQFHLAHILAAWTGMTMGNGVLKSSVVVEGACASGSHAVRQAVFAVASGMYDLVLAGAVQQGNSSWNWKNPACAGKMSNVEVLTGVYGHLDQAWELPNMNMMDHVLNQWVFAYAQKYGLNADQILDVFDNRVISNWLNGSHTPGLYFNTPMDKVVRDAGVADIHEFLRSAELNPVVLWPLRHWDYTRRCDGAAAIIICAAESSKCAKSIPIHYLGTGNALQPSPISRDMYTQPFIVEAGRQAYEMAQISAGDVDVIEMYDFVPAEYLVALEDLGYWGRGQTPEMLASGQTLYSGARPVNPSSGGVTCGVTIGAVGATCTAHLVRQLRGEAGTNQVKPLPDIGLVYDCGAARNAVIHILGR